MSDPLGFNFSFDFGDFDPLKALGIRNAQDAAKLGAELLFKRDSLPQMGARLGFGAAMQMVGAMAPGADAMMHDAAEAHKLARARWEEYLRTCEYGLFPVWGRPGEGKTTLACDIMERYFAPAGRPCFWIGLPQEVLPAGWREIPLTTLRKLGREILDDPDHAKQYVRRILPPKFCLGIDDASLYLPAKGHMKPESHALQAIVNVRRHVGGVIIPTFQNFGDVNKTFLRADAYLMKMVPGLSMPPAEDGSPQFGDRDEIRVWLRKAMDYFADPESGQPRMEHEQRIFRVFVAAPDIGFVGPWVHQRPKWYTTEVSENASLEGDEEDLIEGEWKPVEQAHEAAMFYCPTHRIMHRKNSDAGQRCYGGVGGLDTEPEPGKAA